MVALPASALAGTVFSVVLGAPWLLARQHFPQVPRQPLSFDHRLHVEQVGLDCAFCHRTATRGDSAGVADVQQCMFCHLAVEPDAAQAGSRAAKSMAQLRDAWVDQQVIDWVRIHHVPDHSRFPHSAHVQAGLPCAACHGEVGQMQQVVQVRSLKMGDCVGCHQELSAPTQCGACHY
jgi:hypothetical protein